MTFMKSDIADIPAREVSIGAPVEFPPDTIVFIESGCTQCDGPPGPLYRVMRIGAGPVILDQVFDVDRAKYTAGEIVLYERCRDGT
jgi:hypothetical protein